MPHAAEAPVPHTVAPDVPSDNLDITTIASDPAHIMLCLRGQMDLFNAERLTAVLADHLEQGRRFVRLDLSELDFLDCSGLSVIIEADNRCRAARGTLILVGASAQVTRLLTITHLDEAPFVADAQAACPTYLHSPE